MAILPYPVNPPKPSVKVAEKKVRRVPKLLHILS